MRIVRAGIGRVDIGRLTDNEARAFAFDVTEMLECMDDGYNISCYATAPNSNEAYLIPPDKYYIEGTDLIWIITDVETAQTGTGKFAITLYNDSGQVVNSQIYKTRVDKSLIGDADPPDAWDEYLLTIEALRDETLDIAEDLVDDVTAIKEQAEDARDDAQDYAERIENMTASASVDANVGVPTVTITKTENPLNLDFAFSNLKGAKGDTGDKGDKGDTGATGSTGATGNGIASISKTGTSGLIDTYTITYTDGDTDTFTVTNGAKGDTGDGWTAAQSAKLDALPDVASADGTYIISQSDDAMSLEEFPVRKTYTTAAVTVAAVNNSLNILTNAALTSITINSLPTGAMDIIFTTGSSVPTLSASWVTFPDDFALEANTRYEINILDGYAVVASWT